MDSPLSSPEREPLKCKVTYLDRKKRKHSDEEFVTPFLSGSQQSTVISPSSDSDLTSIKSVSPMKPPASPKNKASVSQGPKKVDISLPGPSPKRARRDSDESLPKSRKSSHIRGASSVSSLKQVADSPSTGRKSQSISAPIRKPNKSVVADDDFDDSLSVADSSISTTRIRRNEGERIEYFKNQPECGNLEPHSAECTKCSKTVNLGRKQTYAVRPWEIHRVRCDQKPPRTVPITLDPSNAFLEAEKPPSPATASKSTPARRPSEAERKEFLEADKQVMELEKHRLCCRKCQDWIDLSATHAYATGNWVKHKIRCSDVVPSNRVAAAKRRLLVVNDKQVKSFVSRKIECAFCSVTVELEGEGDFDLTKWDEHKSKCTQSNHVSENDIVNSVPFPAIPSRPPHSFASTEDTVVVDGATLPLSQGVKRSRGEESVEIDDDEARPSARQRTASYSPHNIEPPNTVMGWFMLPFHSFVRGFTESLKDRS